MHLEPLHDQKYNVVHTITDVNESPKVALALLGKMAVSGSYCVLYLFSAELFPTEVRYDIVWNLSL